MKFAFNTSGGGVIPGSKDDLVIENATVRNTAGSSAKTLLSHGEGGNGRETVESADVSVSRHYWKFAVNGIAAQAIESAKLRIYVEESGSAGMTVYQASNYLPQSRTLWHAGNLAASAAPELDKQPLASFETLKTAGWVEIDVTDLIDQDGEYSFAVAAGNAAKIANGINNENQKPQLTVTVAGDENQQIALRGDAAADSDASSGAATLLTLPENASLANQTGSLPESLLLGANYPDPFNATTSIEYALPAPARVKLEIFNTLGQKVRSLVNENQAAGYQKIVWQSKDDQGMEVSSGVYFIQLTVGAQKLTGKMTLLK